MQPLSAVRLMVSWSAAAVLVSGALAVLARPVRAQQRWEGMTVSLQLGGYQDTAPGRDDENRWGWSVGVHLDVPIAHRVYALGTLAFLRINNRQRVTSNRGRGGFVYAAETIPATVGVGFDLLAHRTTRFLLGVEVGPFWSRNVETDRFGSPLPGAATSEAFSVSVAAIASLSIQHALTSRVAVDITPRAYIGEGGVAPALGAGVAFRLP